MPQLNRKYPSGAQTEGFVTSEPNNL